MEIEQINQLFSKYGLSNFNKQKSGYIFKCGELNSNEKISDALFSKMLEAAQSATVHNIKIPNLTFGIELEFVGTNNSKDISDFDEAMISLLGYAYKREPRYCHNDGLYWLLGKDGSIKFNQSRDNPLFGYELSTPTLSFNSVDLQTLERVLDYIKTYLHGTVNNSCGTHIHIGFSSEKIFRENVQTMLAVYSCMESTVFDPMVPISRRRNTYCKQTCTEIREKYRKLSARYCRFNYSSECCLFHIECRQLEGTLDLNTIMHWLRLQYTVIYDIISHVEDNAYLYKLRYSNAFDILFRYNFTKELVSFFIDRIVNFKSRTIQSAVVPAIQ